MKRCTIFANYLRFYAAGNKWSCHWWETTLESQYRGLLRSCAKAKIQIVSSVSRYTAWYGKRFTGARRTASPAATRGTGAPACGKRAIWSRVSPTAVRNRTPRPAARSSYQRIVSSSSRLASSSIRSGFFTASGGLPQVDGALRARVGRWLHRQGLAAPASRSPLPKQPRRRHEDRSLRRGWPRAQRRHRPSRRQADSRPRGAGVRRALSQT